MNPPQVSDSDRKKLQAAIAAALATIYLARYRSSQSDLGVTDLASSVYDPAQDAIDRLAAERATLVQDGLSSRFAQALDELPEDATATDQRAALSEAWQGAQDHHNEVLIPFLVSWASHQGLVDAYQDTPSADDPAVSAADATLWGWTQMTSFEDDCTEAMDASPAALGDLISITGSIPPVHENCQCQLEPA